MPPWPRPTDVPARVAAAGWTSVRWAPPSTTTRTCASSSMAPTCLCTPNIGVDPTTGAMSAVHTHEGDGTIHIEADTDGEMFTLGQLFTQWGVG